MTLEAIIRSNVGKLYEAFPYPSYPLLLPLSWGDGYAGTAGFAARLARHAGYRPALWEGGDASILLAGCGEALPYVLRKCEPAGHSLVCLDLSRRSLRRARLRLMLDHRPTQFIAADLTTTAKERKRVDAHFDSYGVLHHLGEPSAAVEALSAGLRPGGTGRVMVYNTDTRKWIRHLQKALSQLGLDGHDAGDRQKALEFLRVLGGLAPAIKERFLGMGSATFSEPARFVDTFFHAWEIQFSPSTWWRLFENNSLTIVGLFDRYAELDDIPNPLWQAPTLTDLLPRIADRRFENNLELYFAKPGGRADAPTPARGARTQLLRALRMAPPTRWFQYDETRDIPFTTRRLLWKAHAVHTLGLGDGNVEGLLPRLSIPSAQRLARVGAVLPGQVDSPSLKQQLLSPMTLSMTPPMLPDVVRLAGTHLETTARKILGMKGKDAGRRLSVILKRCEKAQT